MEEEDPKQLKLFYAYSDKDKNLQQELDNNLYNTKRNNNIVAWSRRDITPGANTDTQIIQDELNAADIILLLISAEFIVSQDSDDSEMRQALRKHSHRTALVIPIILDYFDWNHPPLNRLKALPNNGFPVVNNNGISERQQFLNIAQGLDRAIAQNNQRRQKYARRRKFLLIGAAIGILLLLLGVISGILFYNQNSQQTANHHSILPSSSVNLTGIDTTYISIPEKEGPPTSIPVTISDGQHVMFDFSDKSPERLIDQYNQTIQESFFTVIVVTTLSDTDNDHGQSKEIGTEELQGLYLWQKTNHVSLKLLTANIGTKDPKVLSMTVLPLVQKIKKFADQNSNFIGVVGFSYSQSIAAAMDYLQSENIPVVSPAASSANFSNKWPYFHRIVPDNQTEGDDAADYAMNSLHTKLAYVFIDAQTPHLPIDSGDPYSKTLGQAFSSTFHGDKPAIQEEYTVGLPDTLNSGVMDMVSQQLFSDNTSPTIIFCACYGNDISALHQKLAQAAQASRVPLPKNADLPANIFLMGGEAAYELGSYDNTNQANKSSNYKNMYFTAFAFADTVNILCSSTPRCSSEQKTFYTHYCETFDSDNYEKGLASCVPPSGQYLISRPGPHTVQAYDAISALQAAYNEARKQQSFFPHLLSLLFGVSGVSREDIQNAFATVSFEGISGHIDFSNSQTPSDPANKAVLVLCANSQGLSQLLTVYGHFFKNVDSTKDFSNAGKCPG